jgi:plasmid stability protein
VRAMIARHRRSVEEEMRTAAQSAISDDKAAPKSSLSSGDRGAEQATTATADSGIRNLRVEKIEPLERHRSPVDSNLVIAYSVLGSVGVALAAALYARFCV